MIDDDEWLHDEFISSVQQRGAAIIAARGASSAASAANAIVETVRNVTQPSGRDLLGRGRCSRRRRL